MQFRPPEEQRPNASQYAQLFGQGLDQIGNTLQEGDQLQRQRVRQAMLDEYLRQENDRKKTEWDRMYRPQGQLPGWGGGQSPMQQTPGIAGTSGNPLYNAPTQMQDAQESPVVAAWKAKYSGFPKPLQDAYTNPNLSRADVMDRVGNYEKGLEFQKTQSEITKNLREQRYLIPEQNAQGIITGYKELPPGVKPTAFAKPLAPGRGGGGNPYLNKEIAKSQAELAEARPLVSSALAEIDRVMPLNDKSRGGVVGAGVQKASSMFGIGTDSEDFKNTADVINTMQGMVAKVLKSTFGGQLSDGERQYLNQVYGALPNLSPQERKIAMQNVKTMLSNKLAASESKFRELSQGIDGQGMGVPGGQPITPNANNDPLGLGL